jgi:hypothetical protein
MIQRLLPAYYFSLECFLLFFMLFISYIQIGEIPPLLTFLAIVILANLMLFFTMRKKVVKGAFPFFSALFLGGISYLFDFTLLSTLICTVFFYFRMDAFLKDSLLWSSERTKLAILNYSISFFIFIEGWIFKYPYMNWLYGIVIIFTILYCIGRFLQQMDKDNEVKDAIPLVTVIGIGVFLTGIVTLLVPITKWIFFKLITLIAIIATFIGRPIFYLFEGIEFQTAPRESPLSNWNNQIEELKEKNDDVYLFDLIPTWVWLVLLVILLFTIWYFVRKKMALVDNDTQSQTNYVLEHSNLKTTMRSKRRLFRQPAPQEYMRKLFFQLHIYAEKHNLGRKQHETIREWFNRVEFQNNEELFIAYDSVRYGKNDIQQDEAKHLEEVIKNLKHEIKERNKEDKG